MRRIPLLAASVVALLVLSACGGNAFTSAAATVDGVKIDEDKFQRQLDFVLADPRFAEQLEAPNGEDQRQQFTRDFLTFMIHQRMVDLYATEHGIEPPAERVEEITQEQVEIYGGQQEFDRALEETGVTAEEVRELAAVQLVRQQVAEEILSEESSDEALRQTYEERLPEYTQVEVSHILVSEQGEAERLARRATPDNFAQLAEEFSQDPSSAVQGGDLGVQRAADLVEPFAEAMLEIPVGEIGGPVQTEFGWHIIHVKDRQVRPFEEVREELLQGLGGEVFGEWLQEELDQVEVRVNPRYGVFDTESAQVIPRIASTPEPPPVQVEP